MPKFLIINLLITFFYIFELYLIKKDGLNSLITAFTFIFLAELGDKTQITSIILAAELCSPIIALVGIMLAFSIITGISIIFGMKILRLLPRKYLKILTSILFIFFGFFFIY